MLAVLALLAPPLGVEGLRLVARYTFEPGEDVKQWRLMWGAKVTTDPEKVISGKGSLLCDTTSSGGVWHEFFWSRPQVLRLKPNWPYLVAFSYRYLKRDKDGFFYFFLRPWSGKRLALLDDRAKIHFRWRHERGKVYRRFVWVLNGPHKDYRLTFGIHKRAAVVVDDVEVWDASGAIVKGPPQLVSPRDGQELSPEAAQLVWRCEPPATKWEVELSRAPDFPHPRRFSVAIPNGFIDWHMLTRTIRPGVSSNFPGYVSLFLPLDIGEGRWFWRVRVKGGRWSEVRSLVIRKRKVATKSFRPSPERPLFVAYADNDPGNVARNWSALPEDLRPFCALRIHATRGADHALQIADAAGKVGARIVLAVYPANPATPFVPLPVVEEIFARHPEVLGAFLAEFYAGYSDRQAQFFARLLSLCHRYGKLLLYADHHYPVNRWLEAGARENFVKALTKHPESAVLIWKTNSPYTQHLVQSCVLGFWLSGLCGAWGVEPENWFWAESRFGRNLDIPPAIYGPLVLLGAMGGATVFVVEGPWLVKGKFIGPEGAMEDVIFPLFRRIVKWRLIPSRGEVLEVARLAYLASPSDVRSPDEDPKTHWWRLRALFDAVYKLEWPDQLVPRRSGRLIFVLPALCPREAVKSLRAKGVEILAEPDLLDEEALKAKVDKVFGKPPAKGDAFFIRVGDILFACNPRECKGPPAHLEVRLRTFSLRATLPVRSWLVGREGGGELLLHVNGDEGRRATFEVSSERPLLANVEPKGRAKIEPLRKGVRITVEHAPGGCDLRIAFKPGL